MKNGSECGVFTLLYADFLSRNSSLNFSQRRCISRMCYSNHLFVGKLTAFGRNNVDITFADSLDDPDFVAVSNLEFFEYDEGGIKHRRNVVTLVLNKSICQFLDRKNLVETLMHECVHIYL